MEISFSRNMCLYNLLTFYVQLSLNQSSQLHTAASETTGHGGALKRQRGLQWRCFTLSLSSVKFFLQEATKALGSVAELANSKKVADGYAPTAPKEQEK